MAQARKAQPKFHLSPQMCAILYEYEAFSCLFGQRPTAELTVSKVDANVISVCMCVCACESMYVDICLTPSLTQIREETSLGHDNENLTRPA